MFSLIKMIFAMNSNSLFMALNIIYILMMNLFMPPPQTLISKLRFTFPTTHSISPLGRLVDISIHPVPNWIPDLPAQTSFTRSPSPMSIPSSQFLKPKAFRGHHWLFSLQPSFRKILCFTFKIWVESGHCPPHPLLPAWSQTPSFLRLVTLVAP